MKKVTCLMISLLCVVFFQYSSVWAGWELYDNFDSGTINYEKWGIDDSSADITIEDGKAKFVHNEGYPNDSSWLIFKDSPETIFAVMVDITAGNCNGDDLRGRIGGYLGKLGPDLVWNQIQVRPGYEEVDGGVYYETDPETEWHYHQFSNPIPIIGETFTLILTFNSLKRTTHRVIGQGEATLSMPVPLSPLAGEEQFKGIGTRSSNGEGPCVFYFDNVRVLR